MGLVSFTAFAKFDSGWRSTTTRWVPVDFPMTLVSTAMDLASSCSAGHVQTTWRAIEPVPYSDTNVIIHL